MERHKQTGKTQDLFIIMRNGKVSDGRNEEIRKWRESYKSVKDVCEREKRNDQFQSGNESGAAVTT